MSSVITVPSNVPAQIVVSAADWQAFNAAKCRAAAMAKEVEALRAVMGLPETAALVKALGATAETAAAAVIVDGNGLPLGKVSVFWRDAYEVKAGFASRVS